MASTSSSRAEFERQRSELMQEIAESFEQVLANINKLNRNLEAVITVGNEFSSVEALWSTFENVMGKEEEEEVGEAEGEASGKKGAVAIEREQSRAGGDKQES